MKRVLAMGTALVAIGACELVIPDFGESFISDQILGRWVGEWEVGGLFQEGTAIMEARASTEEGIVFQLWLAGGAMSKDDEPPHEIRLTGQDGAEELILTGHSDKIGDVTLTVTAEGQIHGEAVPGSITTVPIGGYVTPDEFYLGFIVLEIFEGQALVAFEGPLESEDGSRVWGF